MTVEEYKANFRIIMDLLKASEFDREVIRQILPQYLRDSQADEHLLRCWAIEVLIARPGFLYDDLHAATQLGVTIEGFRKILKKYPEFRKAKYTGIGMWEGRDHWWRGELLSALGYYDKSSTAWEKGISIQERARKILKPNVSRYGHCPPKRAS